MRHVEEVVKKYAFFFDKLKPLIDLHCKLVLIKECVPVLYCFTATFRFILICNDALIKALLFSELSSKF